MLTVAKVSIVVQQDWQSVSSMERKLKERIGELHKYEDFKLVEQLKFDMFFMERKLKDKPGKFQIDEVSTVGDSWDTVILAFERELGAKLKEFQVDEVFRNFQVDK